MFTHRGNAVADGNVSYRRELYEVHYRDSVVASADIGVKTKAGAQERRAMFAREDQDGRNQQKADGEDDAEFRGAIQCEF